MMAQKHKFTNRLIYEDSPYLRQHAHNPIAWYPWGQEAFEKAQNEQKLIFLSIGYSTCHWCHVMERESFENEEIADYMNSHYINIKVDREELPHIDRYFQDVYMLLNKRSGGWPLTIIMTPERKPFYAATYLPPFNRYGRPGLLGMAQYLYETFRDKRENVYKSADSIVAAMENVHQKKEPLAYENQEASEMAVRFVQGVDSVFDTHNKGIGDVPKFPHASTLLTLLHIYRLKGDEKALHYATQALEAMANGGIYDQIEGGFYRYSVDAQWMIPHFEKMLYTNAELLEVYSEAYMLTENPLFEEVARLTIRNLDERFYHKGLYFSASDADSEGEEGKYFLYDYRQSREALAQYGMHDEEIREILAYWHITPEGNFEGKSNPYVSGKERRPGRLEEARKVLLALRSEREYPFIDYKIQTSWNALLAKGLFKAAVVDAGYAEKGLALLDRIVEVLIRDGQLYHQVVLPNPVKIKGYLEDYAFLIDALLEAYHISFQERYLSLAEALQTQALSRFYQKGRWYMSDDDFRSEAAGHDASYRSALAVMLQNMLRLATLKEELAAYQQAQNILKKQMGVVAHAPVNAPTMTDTFLQEGFGWSVLKADQPKLQRHRFDILHIRYPYLVCKVEEIDGFLACKVDRCFAHSDKIEDIVEKLQ